MNPQERELLTGVGNCYEACHEGFEETVEMVASTRHRTPDDVKATLKSMKERFSSYPDYQRLRARVPPEFPL